jgi:hypothetical protein
VIVTMHPTALYHMVVSSGRSYADLLRSIGSRTRKLTGVLSSASGAAPCYAL